MFRFPHLFGRPLVAAAVSSVVTAVAVGGVAVAAGSSDTTVIQACVNNGNGVVRVVDRPAACTTNETPLTWNQVGPTGPAGPAGPIGPAGPAGEGGAGAREARILINPSQGFNVPSSWWGQPTCTGAWFTLGNWCGSDNQVTVNGQESVWYADLDASRFPVGASYTLTAKVFVNNGQDICTRLVDADTGAAVEGSTDCFTSTNSPTGAGWGATSATFTLPAGAHTYAVQYQSPNSTNAGLNRAELLVTW